MKWTGLAIHLWPFVQWARTTRLGRRLFVVTPDSKNGFGLMMRFRDELFEKRLRAIERGEVERVDILQSQVLSWPMSY